MFESIMVSLIVGYFIVGLLSMGLFPLFIKANDKLNAEYENENK